MNAQMQDEPQEIETLLPWHAAGTLNRRDAQRVEAALKTDSELARRFELVREELGEAIHLNESLGAPSVRAMDKLFKAIDAERPTTRKSTFSLGAWLTDFVGGFAPRTLAFAGSAAALVLLLQAGVITGVLLKDRAGPDLAGYGETSTEGRNALVQFAPQASAAEIQKFLEAYKAVVVDGPKGGLFTIRVTDAAATKDFAAFVARMQNEKAVVAFVSVSK